MLSAQVERVPPADRLDTLPSDDLRPDGTWNAAYWEEPGRLTLGWYAIGWIEGRLGAWSERLGAPVEPQHATFMGLRQPNGPRVGRVVRLTQRQRRFLLWWYAVDINGRWLFHHGVRRLSKGSGKSPFMAMLCLFELCGPCRVLRVLNPDHPVPVLRVQAVSVSMPWVQIAATTESQTHNTMRMVRAMAAKRGHLANHYGLDPGKTMIYSQPEGKLEIITSSFTAAEGAEPSALIGDETEHSVPANGGPELMRTLADNAAKSGARMIETCNAWVPDRESVAEDTFDAWVAQEEGRSFNDTRILYDAVRGTDQFEANLADRDATRAELLRIYADCDWKRPHVLTPDGADLLPVQSEPPDIESIMGRIYDPRSRTDDTVRKYGNLPTAAEDAWLDPAQWSALREPRLIDPDEPIVLFFDGSKSRDATALTGCAMSDGYTFELQVWERPLDLDGKPRAEWEVPITEVDRWVRRSHEDHNVVAFFADVREWESFVHTTWPANLPVDDYLVMAKPAGRNAGPIAWDMRGHVADFTAACEITHDAIEKQTFRHCGSSATARHIGNARNRPNGFGMSIGKESPNSSRKIDAAVTVIGAQMVRRLVLASDAWREREAPAPEPKRKAGRVTGW